MAGMSKDRNVFTDIFGLVTILLVFVFTRPAVTRDVKPAPSEPVKERRVTKIIKWLWTKE